MFAGYAETMSAGEALSATLDPAKKCTLCKHIAAAKDQANPAPQPGAPAPSSGNDLANRLSVNGVIFGATVLAAATALPEISSGIAAVRLGDHALAMGDIFGGNAFQVCLFLVADLVAGKPVLPSAGDLNAWLAALGVALTAIYGFGVISRPMHCRFRLGPDSLLALAFFGLGIAGLFAVPH